MLIIKPPLSYTGCQIRRHMNCSEKLSECNERRKIGYWDPCTIEKLGNGNPTILSLTNLLTYKISVNIEDEEVADSLLEVVEAIESMVAKAVAICGLGLEDEGTVRK